MTPKIGYGDASSLFNDGYTDSHFVESGNYLKLSTLALGYTLPKAVVSKLNMTKIRFYVQGQNLLTITGYSGLDPETNSRLGVDWNGMPATFNHFWSEHYILISQTKKSYNYVIQEII